MENIVSYNKNTLKSVEQWIKREDYDIPNSIFNYGLPERIFHLIDTDISDDLTECDIICYFIYLFNKDSLPINYIELGVSVGKTFYQICKYTKNNINIEYSINGLDLEKINPILKKLLFSLKFDEFKETTVPINLYQTSGINRNTNLNTILKWNNSKNNIMYYESDVFDIDIWKHMDKKYNIIFSDAFHEPHALLIEYNNLKNNNLIDLNKFIYCFDDLEDNKNGNMWGSVISIYNDISNTTGQKIFLKHYKVNGWIGNNESKHNFGIISSFDYIIPGINEIK
jgi:hypothetical protein